MKKRLLIALCCVTMSMGQVMAQTFSTLSSYPTLSTSTGINGGITFQLNTTQYLHIKQFLFSMADIGDSLPIEIYHKAGFVEGAGGAPPVITAPDWVHWGTTSVSVKSKFMPVPTKEIDLYLPPGPHAFFIISPGYGINFKSRFPPTMDTLFTDGVVSLKVDTIYSYGGNLPSPSLQYLGYFIGGLEYYSYTHQAGDLAIVSIESPILQCPGTNDVIAKLRNYGSTQINTVTVNWSIDGNTQTPVTYTNLIDTIHGSGSYEALVTLGTINQVEGVYQDIAVWTSMPNGVADPNPANDSAFASVVPSLSGVYTINPSGTGLTNFASFTDANAALQERGVCGPVTFNAAPGVYNEHIKINEIRGASAASVITFQKDPALSGAVEMNYASTDDTNNYVVYFNGADHFTFDGISMTNNGIAYSRVVVMEKEANFNTISNCSLTVPIATIADVDLTVIFIEGSNNNNNKILHNDISGGGYGILCTGASNDYISGIVIDDNIIDNPHRHAIQALYVENSIISNNKISSQSLYSGSSYAIYSNRTKNVNIIGNEIYGAGEWPRYGMYLRSCDGTNLKSTTVANNLVHNGDPTLAGDYAVYIRDCSYLAFVHNNIATEGTSTSQVSLYHRGTAPGMVFYNNNIVNYGVGYAMRIDITGQPVVCDYNNIASAGSNLCYLNGGIGNVADLATWQTTGNGANSVSIDSIFTNLDSLRTCDNRIEGKGLFIPSAPTDIDGEARSATPDIGADEFSIDNPVIDLGDDLTICAGDPTELSLLSGSSIKYGNYGWSTSDTTPSIIVNSAGTYSLTLSNGCVAAVSDTVEVSEYPVPVADFTATMDEVHKDVVVGFTNNSTDGIAYHWDFGDSTSSTSKDAFHTYSDFGIYTVTLTVYGICDTVSTTQDIDVNYTGINNPESGIRNLRVWPNPAKEVLYIQVDGVAPTINQLQMINLQGQVVDCPVAINNGLLTLDVSNLGKGMYLLQIAHEDGLQRARVMIE